MTREEQIKQAAAEYAENKAYPSEKAFVAGAEWADHHQPSPWISVEDRLPKEGERCLNLEMSKPNTYAAIDVYSKDGWETGRDKVTHWMPIPPIKKGE